MKRRDLDRELKKAGWKIEHGSNHDKARHPDRPGVQLTLPRHAEVKEMLAKAILKAAGWK